MTAKQKSNGHKQQGSQYVPPATRYRQNAKKKVRKVKTLFSDVILRHEEKPNIIKEAMNRLTRAFPDRTCISFDGEKFLQQRWLLQMGIKICECCGMPMPIEREKCPACLEEFLIKCD